MADFFTILQYVYLLDYLTNSFKKSPKWQDWIVRTFLLLLLNQEFLTIYLCHILSYCKRYTLDFFCRFGDFV